MGINNGLAKSIQKTPLSSIVSFTVIFLSKISNELTVEVFFVSRMSRLNKSEFTFALFGLKKCLSSTVILKRYKDRSIVRYVVIF